MKTKRNLFTALGVLVSLSIAVGGWFLANALIEAQSSMLLSSSGTRHMDAGIELPKLSDSDNDNATENTLKAESLTEEDILHIVRSRYIGTETPHEPVPGQIDMAQAVEISNAMLSKLSEILSIEEEYFYSADVTYALLAQIITREVESFNPIYSIWRIQLSSSDFEATFSINSVTGQVLELGMRLATLSLNIDERTTAEILDIFVSELGLQNEAAVSLAYDDIGGITVYKPFADGEAYAVAGINEFFDTEPITSGISLYITDSFPIDEDRFATAYYENAVDTVE